MKTRLTLGATIFLIGIILLLCILLTILFSGCVDTTGHQHREKGHWYYETYNERG